MQHEEPTCRLILVSSMLFSVRLEIVKVWLFSSKFIFRVALELVLQLQEMNGSKMKSWIKLFFLLLFK